MDLHTLWSLGAGKDENDSHEAARVKKLKPNAATRAIPSVYLARPDFLST